MPKSFFQHVPHELQSMGMPRKVPSRELRAALGRILQGHSDFVTRVQTNDFNCNFDCEILAMLAAEGYEPSGQWLIDNLERLVPKAGEKTLPSSCAGAP